MVGLVFSGCILIPNSYCSEVAFNTQHSSQIWSRIISWNSELVHVPSQSLVSYSVTLGTEVHKAPLLFHGIFQARILEWVAISFSWGRNSADNNSPVQHLTKHLVCGLPFSSQAQEDT